MGKIIVALAVVVSFANPSWTQQSPVPPQTARQALMEMFFSKTPGTLLKHLPNATRNALDRSGALAALQQYSTLVSQVQAQGQQIQTFETGPVMLSGQDPKTGQKVEITVQNDTLRGEEDDIVLSFRTYKGGQVQRTPFLPLMTFSMKSEAQVWKLNEISITIHLPLADPDLLKALTEKMQPQPTPNVTLISHSEPPVHSETSAQPTSNDAMIVSAMRMILAAEATYASRYPSTGYACTLSNLDGFGGGEPSEHQAMLINSGLASGKKYGFIFTISDCTAMPATGFHLTAAPNGSSFGRKAFCADQSGAIRASEDGNPATCLASGTHVP